MVEGPATVGRLSNNVLWTFRAIRKIFEKSRWTVTWQWSEVTRPSADCQTTFFGRFKQFGRILKRVTERSRESGRRSRHRRPTVKQRFLDVSSNQKIYSKKSLNGHATVVGGHATIGRLSNKVFSTFQANKNFFEKSHWTVTRQWSEVTRISADCQTTFFRRSKQIKKILKNVAERSRDSGRRSRDCRPTVKQPFFDGSSNKKIFWIKSLNGHATVVGGHATVGRLSNNVFWRFKQFGKILKKVAERSRDSGRRSRDHRPTVKQRFFDVTSKNKKFWKKVTERSRDSGRRSRDRRPTIKQNFWTFRTIRKFFEKSHSAATQHWSEVTRPSADCQTTFQDVSSNFENFWKKSLNSHATVVLGHATVGLLSNDVFERFKQFGEFLK